MSFKQRANSDAIVGNESVKNHFKMANLAGTKWSHVGSGRTGINSVLDKKIIADHLETKERNMGKGYIKLNLADGSADTPLNIGGRMMYPDKLGNYLIIDSSVVAEMQKSEEEKREYLEGIIEKASLSNSICALILGQKDEAALKLLLGPGKNGDVDNMSADLAAVDCMPETIETLDPTGQTYSRAIQKFKLIIKMNMPMLDNMTPAKTLNQEK
jgi:hypothetical protein